MRFIDLFCGAGLASHGLMQAGLVPALGVDVSEPALEAYGRNVARALACDLARPVPRDVVLELIHAHPHVAWLSPPDVLHTAWERRTWTLEDPGVALIINGCRLASMCRPAYIVLEVMPGTVNDEMLGRLLALMPGYSVPELRTIDAHRHAGAPAVRERAYVIWTLAGEPRPVPIVAEQPARLTVVDAIDRRLPVQTGPGTNAKRTKAISRLLAMGGGMADCRAYSSAKQMVSGLHGNGDPHPPIHGAAQYLYVYNGGWRMAEEADFKRALGAPDDFALAGVKAQRLKQIAGATDSRVAALIGRSLMQAARSWSLRRRAE